MKQSLPGKILTCSKTLKILLVILLAPIIEKPLQGRKLKAIIGYSINFLVKNILLG
jgi:hypothetical protein